MLEAIFASLGPFLGITWWLWAFLILLPLFISTWLFWRNELYKHSKEFKCVVLEIRIPREIRKSPRAMEQVFMAIHSLRNAPGALNERWWYGEVTRWFSLEIVSFGGETRFFIRLYHRQQSLVEAAFFSYYPDVELIEVPDYAERFPKSVAQMHEQGLELWGTEMELVREDAYPIKTYDKFESPEEEKQYDPISAFLEVMGKIQKEEIVGIQILIAPADSKEWREEWEELITKLKEKYSRGEEKQRGPATIVDFPGGPLPALTLATGKEEGVGVLKKAFTSRTPGETDVIQAIEENIARPAFETLIRFIYISPKTIFYDSFARRGLVGAFNQYAALDLNVFRQNRDISTRVLPWKFPFFFPKLRNEYRKERLLFNYRHREMPHETFMGKLMTSHLLNFNFASHTFKMATHCLATLFHPPTYLVLTAPHIRRVESKKAGPPAGLPIYGEEEMIEKYK